MFTQLDTTHSKNNGYGLLQAIEHILSSVFIPSLRRLNNGWGDVYDKRADFLNTLDSFVSVLVGAQESLDEKVGVCNVFPVAAGKFHEPS